MAPVPHVAQVLDMHGRNAAQHAVRQVELRLADDRVGVEQDGVARIDVGDHAGRHGQIEPTRLCRNVGGRIVQAQVRRQIGLHRFGDHLAMPVRMEAVDHHAIDAGGRGDALGDGLQGRVHFACAASAGHRARQRAFHRIGRRYAVLGVGQPFDDVVLVVAMRDHGAGVAAVEHEAGAAQAGRRQARQRPREPARGPGAQRALQRLFEQIVSGHAEQQARVAARAQDPAFAGDLEQAAVRLDGARNVDGFVFAAHQVDGGRRRKVAQLCAESSGLAHAGVGVMRAGCLVPQA